MVLEKQESTSWGAVCALVVTLYLLAACNGRTAPVAPASAQKSPVELPPAVAAARQTDISVDIDIVTADNEFGLNVLQRRDDLQLFGSACSQLTTCGARAMR